MIEEEIKAVEEKFEELKEFVENVMYNLFENEVYIFIYYYW